MHDAIFCGLTRTHTEDDSSLQANSSILYDFFRSSIDTRRSMQHPSGLSRSPFESELLLHHTSSADRGTVPENSELTSSEGTPMGFEEQSRSTSWLIQYLFLGRSNPLDKNNLRELRV